jgi:hypothetical protein
MCLGLYFPTANLTASRPVTQLQNAAEYYVPSASQLDASSLRPYCRPVALRGYCYLILIKNVNLMYPFSECKCAGNILEDSYTYNVLYL